jgi:hypothetical protein
MPPVSVAPAAYKLANPGGFGTMNMPSKFHNVVYCQLPSGDFKAIYADTDVIGGLTDRGYVVDNDYQVCGLRLYG